MDDPTQTLRRPAGALSIDIARCSTAELLAELLMPGHPPQEARQLAEESLAREGGLRKLLRLKPEILAARPGWKRADVALLTAAQALLLRHQEEQLHRGTALGSPGDTIQYLRMALRDREREVFTGVFLDTRHRVILSEELFKGSIDGACVYPRVVAEKALRYGAAAVIVAHNHPSGVAEPSLADQAITRRLKEALALLEIRLLDHFVIGDGEPVSMACRGLL
jgi:DNA repair protein RadC